MRLKIILFCFILIFFYSGISSALIETMCATSEISSINPSSVGFDEDFTVGIIIENCGGVLAENVVFEITRHSEDILIKEPLIFYVGNMGYASSKRFILFNMRTSLEAKPGEHFFETRLTYGKNNFSIEKESNFSIVVNTQEPDLAISRVYTNPEIILEGEKIILTIDVENSGNGDAKDVRVELIDLDLRGVKQKYLGKIGSGENMPARFVFDRAKKGFYSGNIKVTYKFAGENQELNFPLEIQIFSKEFNYFYLVLLVLVLGVFGYFLYKKKLNYKN